MNGQFPPCDPASGQPGIPRVQPRLVVALLLSCLLHLALLVAAYLGGTPGEGTPATRDNPRPARPFSASLKELRPTGSAAVQSASAVDPARGLGALPVPAPPYYTTDQLTKRPQPLGSAELDAPDIHPIVASGKIILKLWINEFGELSDVEVEKTELPEVISLSTVAAFKRLRFTPGERGGVRVGSVMRIEVSYDDVRSPPR